MPDAKYKTGRRKAVGLIVTGIPEIDAALKKLPARVGAKVVRQELDKQARATTKKAKVNAPVFVGVTKRMIRPTRAKSGKQAIHNRVLINWRGVTYFETGFYPAFVEYGTKNGVRAQHYMKKTYETAGPGAAKSLEKAIAAGVEKEAAKLAEKN